MCKDQGMTNEQNTMALDLAKAQVELSCIETFLTTITKRDDVPGGVKAGAEHYLKNIRQLRDESGN